MNSTSTIISPPTQNKKIETEYGFSISGSTNPNTFLLPTELYPSFPVYNTHGKSNLYKLSFTLIDDINFRPPQLDDLSMLFNKEEELALKIKREIEKRRELLETEDTENINCDLIQIRKFLTSFESNKIGVELTKRGSFIFTVFFSHLIKLYITYNALAENKDEKLFYRLIINKKDIEIGIGELHNIFHFIRSEIINRYITSGFVLKLTHSNISSDFEQYDFSI